MRLIIIGGVAAGAKAAAKARRVDPNLEIIVYQEEADVSYSACGMPYVIGGTIPYRDNIIIRRPSGFARSNIQVFTRHRVEAIDCAARELQVHDLEQQRRFSISYDRLIVATGARPIIPDIPGVLLAGVAVLRSLQDMDNFRDTLQNLKPRSAAIIGAGYIGLELAESLQRLGIATMLIERLPRILPAFDAEIAQLVGDYVAAKGVEMQLGTGVAGLIGEGGRLVAVQMLDGRNIPVDLAVLAIGIRPNVALAQQSGITLGPTGAIRVNERMQTNVPNVFAAGDCCETVNRITGKPYWMPLGDIANLQGRVAGENAAGGSVTFPGCFGTAIFRTFDYNVAMTGLSEEVARENGFEPITATINTMDKARYYPDARDITLKLVADKSDGRLLGAQAVGRGAVDKLIDIAATALLGKLRCIDLENGDFAYSPPFSPVLSPISVAAAKINDKLEG